LRQISNTAAQTVASDRTKLFPILSSILFCATNDLALRGKEEKDGHLQQLFDFLH